MRAFAAFLKKEFLCEWRTGRILIFSALFTVIGLMNPAITYVTPWLMETLSDSLAAVGMSIQVVSVSALDSWVQFFKNMPIALIAFVILESSIFCREYRTGTLILSLTKGLSRKTVVACKAIVLVLLWSAGYWLSFLISYFANTLFWDNSLAQSLLFAVSCWWVFGLWVISVCVFISVLSKSNLWVLTGTGGAVLLCTVLSFLPKLGRFLPTYLLDGSSLIFGVRAAGEYLPSLIITTLLTAALIFASIPVFNKKQL